MSALRWPEVASLIDGSGLAHLATSSPAGDPHVAIVATARDGETLWIAARSSSAKAANVQRNPKAALVWRGNSAETYLWGSARAVTDSATRSRLWGSGLFPYDMAGFFGSVDSPDWLLIEIVPDRVVAIVQTSSGLERRSWSSRPAP